MSDDPGSGGPRDPFPGGAPFASPPFNMPRPPQPPRPSARTLRRGRRGAVTAAIIALLVFVVWPLLRGLAGVWIDYLWFGELHQTSVWWTRLLSPLVVGVIFGIVTFVLVYVNLRIARRLAPRAESAPKPEGLPSQFQDQIARARQRFGPWLDRIIFWGSVFLGFVNGASMAANWEQFRLALLAVPFPYTDPQFHVNVAFFVFTYPALRTIADWLIGVLILTTILTAIVHLLDGAIQPWARLRGFAPHVKAHLSVLMALIVAVWGFTYWLDIYGLDFSLRGQVVGAGYTDVHAQLPAYRILIVISVVTAILLLVNIRYQGWRIPAVALGIWIGAVILLGGVFPALMQQFYVQPNEVALETPYITRNIQMTRLAWGLAAVRGRQFPANQNLSAADVLADRQTLSNVRLWDPAITDKVYAQLQTLRPYYEFPEVNVDRYVVDGVRRQVMVAAREIDTSLLSPQAQTWVNEHLVYTHGNGLVISPASESTSGGLPAFLVGNVPPVTSTNLVTKQSRIYFGKRTTDYVVVDTGTQGRPLEFDYPLGQLDAYYTYKGAAGTQVGSLPRRLAWAMDLGTAQILFSAYVKPTSRVLIRRDLMTRVQRLAPFLAYEPSPYPVLVNGRIKWIIDAYTDSAYFPYSENGPEGDTNYLRNSVKVVIDAFDGTTTFYAFDPSDPVLQTWEKVYPGLFTSVDKVPPGLREHFRYPQGLFSAQAEIYRTYHMTDPRVFYNKEDSWDIPNGANGQPMAPFYVLMKLPGESAEHFYMMQPYVPLNKQNMIGWVAANSDPVGYGQRTVYLFPKERVVLGPSQVFAQINQDPVISPQLSLWNQRGSQVLYGNMIVIPIKDSIVYILPLFLQAEQTAIPQLTRVIVVYGGQVAMENTLEASLLKIFGAQSLAGQPPSSVPATGSASTTGTAIPTGTAADARLAAQLYQQAVSAQERGDWATYGARLKELGRVLSRLAASQGR